MMPWNPCRAYTRAPRCRATLWRMQRLSPSTIVRIRAFLPALLLALVALSALSTQPALAQIDPAVAGRWIINEKLSDNTDDEVEKTLKAMGQKVKSRFFSRNKEYYRGGPVEQELYDRLSYDRELLIEFGEERYLFTYAGEFERSVFLDDRRRSVSLTGLDTVEDFSFGHWENGVLLVEARPRDGGFAEESYRLVNNGTQLELRLYIQPQSFSKPVELKRVFDRMAP
jgi:hypothetical protein